MYYLTGEVRRCMEIRTTLWSQDPDSVFSQYVGLVVRFEPSELKSGVGICRQTWGHSNI